MARVPYVDPEDLDPEYRDLVVSSLQPGKTVNVYSAIGNNQEVLAGFRGFLGALWTDSGLGDRHREIVILTVASELGSTYEWHQHVNIATDAGLSEAEVTALARDDREPFGPTEARLIAYAHAVARGRVVDPIADALAEDFDDSTIAGIATTAAGYVALGLVIDALGVDLEAGASFVGWDLDAV